MIVNNPRHVGKHIIVICYFLSKKFTDQIKKTIHKRCFRIIFVFLPNSVYEQYVIVRPRIYVYFRFWTTEKRSTMNSNNQIIRAYSLETQAWISDNLRTFQFLWFGRLDPDPYHCEVLSAGYQALQRNKSRIWIRKLDPN